MSYYLNAFFSLTIGLGAILGLTRFKKTTNAFLPFLILVWVSFINEVLSIGVNLCGYSNAINYNAFSLAEGLLITWQFKRWGLFTAPGIYPVIQGSIFTWWCYESFAMSHIYSFNSYYFIAYSFTIVLFSIYTVSEMLFYEGYQLLRNSKFLICIGFIAYFTYSLLIETFTLFGLNQSKVFRVHIYEILAYINLLTNIIYAIAVLWIPMKPRYILLS